MSVVFALVPVFELRAHYPRNSIDQNPFGFRHLICMDITRPIVVMSITTLGNRVLRLE